MTNHSCDVININKTHDGAIAVCVRCCGDATTDSWTTIYATSAGVPLTEEMLDERIAAHKTECAAKHEAADTMIAWAEKHMKAKDKK